MAPQRRTVDGEGEVNNLKMLRENNAYSLQDLAELCGVSKPQLHVLEKPDANPTLLTAYKIASVFDVRVTDIWPNNFKVIETTIKVRRVVGKEQTP